MRVSRVLGTTLLLYLEATSGFLWFHHPCKAPYGGKYNTHGMNCMRMKASGVVEFDVKKMCREVEERMKKYVCGRLGY